ncbi:MAG: lamin tail domain-containing protein [Myxococcota bacterium]
MWLLTLLTLVAGAAPTVVRVSTTTASPSFETDDGASWVLAYCGAPQREAGPVREDLQRELERDLLGKQVTLERRSTTTRDVAVTVDSRDVALKLLEQGLCSVDADRSDVLLPRYLTAQAHARSRGRGLWALNAVSTVGRLVIRDAVIDAPGDDRRDPTQERITLLNLGPETLNLAHYGLVDLSGRRFDLPELAVPPGRRVTVRSGRGRLKRAIDAPLEVFLATRGPVWNNRRERIVLVGPHGYEIDRITYRP